MKNCNRCLQMKPLFDFSKAKTYKDGHRNYCKECQSSKKKQWYHENKEHCLKKAKEWCNDHPEEIKQHKDKWRDLNPNYNSKYKKEWIINNKDKINAGTSARRRRVRAQQPLWASRKQIKNIYLNCPVGYHVDHIIPLHGKYVSGLHIETNLQYLSSKENMKKGNKYAIHEEGS